MEKRPDLSSRLGKPASGPAASDQSPPKEPASKVHSPSGTVKDGSLGMGETMTYRPSLDVRLGKVTDVPGGPTQSGPGGSVKSGGSNDEGI